MHCHVEFHSESGMALLFKVGDETQLPPAPENWPQCGNYEFSKKNGGDCNRNGLSFVGICICLFELIRLYL